MRIRNYRHDDLPVLVHIQQMASQTDELEPFSEEAFVSWLTDPAFDVSANTFVCTDDDDELQTWGQGGTLEGMEGEIVGYTTVHLLHDHQGYHVLCQGTMHPQYRRQHAGRALLMSALNRAHVLTSDFEFEAEAEGTPIYFEALLPVNDATAPLLAAKCEMQPTAKPAPHGVKLYQREL
jgi:ribosomal protein S18 acetylase RimI-like enzyme